MAKDLTLKTPDGSTILYPKTVSNLVYDNTTGTPISNWIKGLDNEPTTGSENLVKSGGVAINIGKVILYNGSWGNPGNAYLVKTYVMSTRGCKYVTLEISRPVTPGYHYCIGYTTTTSISDIGISQWTGHGSWAGKNRAVDPPYNTKKCIALQAGEVGIGFVIGEYSDADESYRTLRTTDFSGYEVRVIASDGNEIYENEIYDLNESIELSPDFYEVTSAVDNGGISNWGNAYKVRTPVFDITGVKKIALATNRKIQSGHTLYFGYIFTSDSTAIGQYISENNLDGHTYIIRADDASASAIIPVPDGAVGVAVDLHETDGNGDVILRKTGFSDLVGIYKDPYNDVVKTATMVTDELVNYYPYTKRNGSQGNPSNAWVITLYGTGTEVPIPVNVGDDIEIRVSKIPSSGFNYYYRLITYNTTSPSGLNTDKERDLTNFSGAPLSEHIIIQEGEKAFTIQLTELDSPSATQTQEHCIPLRTTSFTDDEITVVIKRRAGASVDVKTLISTSIFARNIDRIPMLTAACRFRKLSDTSKDFQMLIVTDSHGDINATSNAIVATNEFESIDAIIHCGDFADHINIGGDYSAYWQSIVNKCKKPFFAVIGNHEAGTYYPVLASPTQEQLYNTFIKPSVDAGHLVSGEYTNGKCYYYHDFASNNIRLIVVNEYETPRIPDTTSYWKPITYSSSYSNYANNTNYTTGNKVNIPGYTEYSFEAVSSFNSGGFYDWKSPSVKYRLGYRWITKTQAQWFLDTLYSTPSGYKVIVACHNPFSARADVDQTRVFSQKNNWVNGQGMQNYMTNDFIADAINAFQSKSNFSTTCTSQYPADMPSYSVSKNFSNAVGTFHSLIGGHVHQDCVWKHQIYNQYQITPICADTTNYAQSRNADIRRPNSTLSERIDTDCLTVVSFGENRIGLVKLGVNVTEVGNKRDFEVIDISS